MNTFRINLLCSLLSGFAIYSVGVAQIHPRELREPAALSFAPPRPVEFTLSNGVRVYYLENRELPLVSITGTIQGGSLYESGEKAGLASLAGTVMRTGGTQSLQGDAMDQELEFLAASVEVAGGDEFTTVNANALKKDVKRVAQLFADVIAHPAFPQEKIDLAKNQMKEGIRRRWDQPAAAAGILFTEQEFGGTAYGRRATFKSLKGITREDLVAFHGRYFVPDNLLVGITGDLSREEAKVLLEGAFKGWAKRNPVFPEIPPLQEKADGTVYYAFRETPQASVVMGHLGIRRGNPDEYKLEVMNDIFGGRGFTARLMKEIRSNRGLTYGIYGGVASGKDRGTFRISSQLKADRCVEALALVKQMIREIGTTPVSDEELDVAKKSLINGFVFTFESKDRIPSLYIERRLEGYPDNYFDTYIEMITRVTKEDVRDVAKKYMDPDKMIVVVVGNEKKFDKLLTALGKVQLIDYKKVAEADKSE